MGPFEVEQDEASSELRIDEYLAAQFRQADAEGGGTSNDRVRANTENTHLNLTDEQLEALQMRVEASCGKQLLWTEFLEHVPAKLAELWLKRSKGEAGEAGEAGKAGKAAEAAEVPADWPKSL